jgi:predicted DCC family thiol-disulfide oxidoreductase YuxK
VPDLPLLVYDGECGFCSSSVRWLARRWRRPVRTVPWQLLDAQELAALGISVEQARTSVWWIDAGHRPYPAHLATAHALLAVRGGWATLGRVLLVPPFRWLAALGYPVVSRLRHLLPGGTPTCRT